MNGFDPVIGQQEDFLEAPNIHDLFVHYSDLYFGNSLGACSVEWSVGRMTRCAGITYFRAGAGCVIRLSEPLLKLRPILELKETLLHEMIHAHLMLRGVHDGPDGHGKHFQAKALEINTSKRPDHQRPPQGYNVTIYHTMVNEVRAYQTHHWRCLRCGNLVRRAMNRKPQEADCRSRQGAACTDPRCFWHQHLRTCGGEYEKIAEPEGFSEKKKRKRKYSGQAVPVQRPRNKDGVSGAAITDYFKRIQPGMIEDISLEDQPSPPASASAASEAADDVSKTKEDMRRKLAKAATRRIQGISGGPSDNPVSSAGGQPGQGATGNDDRILGEGSEAGTSRQGGNNDDDWLLELDDWGKTPGTEQQGALVGRIASGQEQHRGPPEIDKSHSLGIVNVVGSRDMPIVPDEEEKRSHGGIGCTSRWTGEVLACPICNRTFQGISNVELNAHIDSCLNHQDVIVLE